MDLIEPIRLLIADDHQLFRSGITSLFDDVHDIVIVAEAENGKELIDIYDKVKPDVALIDISMPELNGLEALKILRKKEKNVKAIFLTMFEGEDYVYYALKIGAKGLLSKNTLKGELIYAIKTVFNGQKYFGKNYDESKLKEIENKYKGIKENNLSEYINLNFKEKKILEYICKGLTSSEIAENLGYSKKTIDYYRSRLMQRINVRTLPELISYAVRYSISNKLVDD